MLNRNLRMGPVKFREVSLSSTQNVSPPKSHSQMFYSKLRTRGRRRDEARQATFHKPKQGDLETSKLSLSVISTRARAPALPPSLSPVWPRLQNICFYFLLLWVVSYISAAAAASLRTPLHEGRCDENNVVSMEHFSNCDIDVPWYTQYSEQAWYL